MEIGRPLKKFSQVGCSIVQRLCEDGTNPRDAEIGQVGGLKGSGQVSGQQVHMQSRTSVVHRH